MSYPPGGQLYVFQRKETFAHAHRLPHASRLMALYVEFFDPDLAAEGLDDSISVEYVSLVSDQTWGPPALVAPNPKNRDAKRANPGDRVLYINPSKVAAFAITEEK